MAFGRLSRGPDAAPLSEINVTPLVDVMLVLVVVFLLTAPLLATSIRLDLPQAAAAPAPAAKAALQLVVDAAGQAFVEDKPLDDQALSARLLRIAADDPDTEVQLRADTAVPYGRVVALLGLAQQAGLAHVGFVALPQPPAAARP
ncbi:biopolymer transporter ExbD [Xylophilus rhododendri]|uniref:Biopolymer transporter ExbD n=1 Tax=Xylophilus rhododendri TaxID=2697032 RepID=A0A857J6Q2_9BURK|nr:biopolymer transporter ExbD [Xylophilus rhododendri]QHI98692.1 biopolymer transporter ExbD [Xylophilus rhododendri]